MLYVLQEEKKKYDRATERYYQFMDKYLAQSPKKGGPLPDVSSSLGTLGLVLSDIAVLHRTRTSW